MTAWILNLITGGERHGESANHRYDGNRTEYQQAAEAGRIVRKGFAGYFWLCHTAGHLQVATGCCPADHRQSGGVGGSPASTTGGYSGHRCNGPDADWHMNRKERTSLICRLKMSVAKSPGLKVRTPAFQAGNDGFEPHRSYCGYKTMVVRQIVALLMGVRFPLVTPWMGMPNGEGSGL